MKSKTADKSALAYSPEELVAGIRAGDESAWRAMSERYEPLLRWLGRQCGLSAEDAGDAVQLTWLRCLEHIDQLSDADRLSGWLATICRRECIRLATRARCEVPLSTPDMAQLIADERAECDPCAEAAFRDLCDRLYLAIKALPERERTILAEMLGREDQSYLDLSRRLGIPVGSIGPTRQRAVSRLRLDPGLAALLGPPPVRDFADRVQVGVGFGARVLLGDMSPELDVLPDRLAERGVVRQPGLVERRQVQRDEPRALLVGDVQVAVDVDDVLEAELAGEPVGPAERLGREPGQVVDVSWHPRGEQGPQHRVGEGLAVEQLLEAVQGLVTAGVLVERRFRHTRDFNRLRWLVKLKWTLPEVRGCLQGRANRTGNLT
jgi:RNA polymerase sigma factor (sigma-70 family)